VTDLHKSLILAANGAIQLDSGHSDPFLLPMQGKTRSVPLMNVGRVIQGQMTSVFRRDPLPEYETLSFSLIYWDAGKVCLDLSLLCHWGPMGLLLLQLNCLQLHRLPFRHLLSGDSSLLNEVFAGKGTY
jgi:hypothetical protein